MTLRRRSILSALTLLVAVVLPLSGNSGAARAERSGRRAARLPSSPYAPLRLDDAGFVALRPSPDARIIYVSSSLGDDANDGLSEEHPVRSVERAIGLARDGAPDFIRFRKGDVWERGLGQWRLSGRSPAEPMVVSSYGSGERPKFRTAAEENGIETTGARGGPITIDYVAFVGLDFESHTRQWGDPAWAGASNAAGVFWLRGTRGVLVEDCVFRSYGVGIVFQAEARQTRIVLHRNLVLDSWDLSHAQSLYIDGVSSIAIDENIIVHKGYDLHVEGSGPTIFSQAIYVQSNSRGVSVRNNIVLNGTSHGLQLRPGGIAQGNLFAHNAIGLLLGGGDFPGPVITGTVADNVILDGTDISTEAPRAWGIDFVNIRSATTTGNIVAHARGQSPGIPIATNANTTYVNNIVHDWGSYPDSPTGPFLDPNRSLEQYNASRGGPGTYDDFVAELRKQSKDRWRTDYMAQAVNAYIRAGFQRR